jgi:hypothetical protein
MRGGKIDPRLPLGGARIPQRLRRNPELHERAPCLDEFLLSRSYNPLQSARHCRA